MISTDYNYKSALFFILLLQLLISSCEEKKTTNSLMPEPQLTPFSVLYNTDTLSLIIETDLQSIIDNKVKDEKIYQPADLMAQDNSETILNIPIEVRPRGVTRKRICDFPPIMLKIKDEQLEALGYKETDNIKLLSYCKDTPLYQSYVMKEYLDYKWYNEVTDYSFKVKLTNITFKDKNGALPTMHHIGFIIEPTDEIAYRMGCDLLPEQSKVKKIHKEQYKNLVVFQYMIGNADWNFSRRHNIRLLSCDPTIGPHPVPYDFDYSGIVNAEYAKPHPSLPIKSVTDRLFQWRGSTDEDFGKTYDLFRSKKLSFYKTCDSLPYLEEADKKAIHEYLDSFYSNIESSATMKKEVLRARAKS